MEELEKLELIVTSEGNLCDLNLKDLQMPQSIPIYLGNKSQIPSKEAVEKNLSYYSLASQTVSEYAAKIANQYNSEN